MNFPNNQKINSILIIRLSSMGDVILTTALIRILRNRFPQAIIDFITSNKFSEILINNPHLSNLIEYDKKWNFSQIRTSKKELLKKQNYKKYDLVIDLQNNLRSIFFRYGIANHCIRFNKHRIKKILFIKLKINLFKPIKKIAERYLSAIRILDVKDDGQGCEIWLPEEINEKQYPPELKENVKTNNFVVGIAAGAHHATKRWQSEKFAELCDCLYSDYKAEILLLGGVDDIEICKKIISLSTAPIQDFSGSKSILETARVLDKCSLLISNDTGVMHIASARKIPVVAIFGSTVPEFGFEPYRVENNIVQKELPCRPCTHIGRAKCPLNHFDCMNLISVQDVIEAITKLSVMKNIQ